MTAAERALLRAVFRWAYAAGWVLSYERSWSNGFSRVDVAHNPHSTMVSALVGRDGPNGDVDVNTVAEGVDVLVAIGILPPRFSTAYRTGWDARPLAVTTTLEQILTPAVPEELVNS